MKWNEVLDEVFSSRLKMRIIRILDDAPAPMTGLRIARKAGYSHTQTYRALADLENLGVISKTYAGASRLYSLNRSNYIVEEVLQIALQAERGMLGALASRFYDRLGSDLVSITLYGSVARHDDEPGSDLDLILTVRDGSDVDSLEDLAAEVSLDAALEFGGPVSAMVVEESRYRDRLAEGKAMWADVAREGIQIPRATVGERKVG
ncbi:MAG: helix-turn-helix domain-containing protein [Actinomycetota bacterium]